jgi:uncharacterized protein YcnI
MARLETSPPKPSRSPHRTGRVVVALGAVALTVPAAVGAHVTIAPPFVESDAPTTIAFATPNERPGHATTALEITAPGGVEVSHADPPPGWSIAVSGNRARWSGGRIEGESEVSFAVVVTARMRAGAATFQASQRYDDGEVVRWDARLTVLPPSAEDSPPEHLRRAVIASVVGLVAIGGGFVSVALRRQRSAP